MSNFTIVNQKFTADNFDTYVAHTPIGSWTKRLILHNTAAPSLAQRPGGILQPKHIDSLHSYYGGKGWSGGPHLFIDAEGIWVFNPLDRKGVHSPSFNKDSWGVEMLGDYGSESFDTGLGLKVHNNSVRAVAALMRRLGSTVTNDNFKLHKEDPRTTHDCPGKNVNKAKFMAEVVAVLGGAPAPVTDGIPTKVVIYRAGAGQDPAGVVAGVIRQGTTYADQKKLAAATGLPSTGTGEVSVRKFVGTKFAVSYDAATGKVYLVEK